MERYPFLSDPFPLFISVNRPLISLIKFARSKIQMRISYKVTQDSDSTIEYRNFYRNFSFCKHFRGGLIRERGLF